MDVQSEKIPSQNEGGAIQDTGPNFYDQVTRLEKKEETATDYKAVRIVVSDSNIETLQLVEWVKSPKAGAVCLFLGTTRDNFEGKKVEKLEYETYMNMAVKEMQKLAIYMLEKWLLQKVAIAHRIGTVPVMESSVLIAVSCPHRKQSFEAAEYGIDQLKAVVPIWKKEIYSDGSTSWKENKEFHATEKAL